MIKDTLRKLSEYKDPQHDIFAKELEELMKTPITLELPPVTKPKFYALVDKSTGDICGIVPQISLDPNIASVELKYEDAEKFLTGAENVTMWIATTKNDSYTLIHKNELAKEKYKRIESLSMHEIIDPNVAYPDIRVEIGARDDAVLIHYNGETIGRWPRPVKLYFTAESNPHYLKCAFTLDVNIINEIQRVNNLPEWPNPIVLPLPDALDVSVFTIKSNIKIAVKRV